MKTDLWIETASELPAENLVVETIIEDNKPARNEQRMFRRGRLWFVEDGSMYVYYTPTHWRPI